MVMSLQYLQTSDELQVDIFIIIRFFIFVVAFTLLLQPSTAIANQLPGHLVSTQTRTIWLNYFIFIIALIVSSTKIA